jgi:hypothetical protein
VERVCVPWHTDVGGQALFSGPVRQALQVSPGSSARMPASPHVVASGRVDAWADAVSACCVRVRPRIAPGGPYRQAVEVDPPAVTVMLALLVVGQTVVT